MRIIEPAKFHFTTPCEGLSLATVTVFPEKLSGPISLQRWYQGRVSGFKIFLIFFNNLVVLPVVLSLLSYPSQQVCHPVIGKINYEILLYFSNIEIYQGVFREAIQAGKTRESAKKNAIPWCDFGEAGENRKENWRLQSPGTKKEAL